MADGNVHDRVFDRVTSSERVEDGVAHLLRNIAAEVMTCAGNESASRSLAEYLERVAPDAGKHVLAGTPVVMATPAMHPQPAGQRAEDRARHARERGGEGSGGGLGPGERWMPEGGEAAGLKETHGHGDELGPGERYATAKEDAAADKKAGVGKK